MTPTALLPGEKIALSLSPVGSKSIPSDLCGLREVH